jgi:heptosyltransferase III
MDAKTQIRKILVIKLRHIGDVLLSSPLFHNLKEAFPQAQISALVNGGTQEMLTGNPSVDQVIVYDRSIKQGPLLQRLSREFSFFRMLRREHFDVVLNLTEGDRGALVALCSGARLRVGCDDLGRGMAGKSWIFDHLIPPPGPSLHAVEMNLAFLATLGVPATQKRVSFHFTESDRVFVAALLAERSLAPAGFCHAHVTSRWMFKTLPHQKIAFLLDHLSEISGLPLVLTCAPDAKEIAYLNALFPLLTTPYTDLSGALTLKQLGALTASARFFVGVDSAPMHMAAALEVPVLALFGPSSASKWGPWDNAALANPYRERNGGQLSGSHRVLQASRSCVPCSQDGCNGSKVSDCLDFPEEQLREVAADFLQMLAATQKVNPQ